MTAVNRATPRMGQTPDPDPTIETGSHEGLPPFLSEARFNELFDMALEQRDVTRRPTTNRIVVVSTKGGCYLVNLPAAMVDSLLGKEPKAKATAEKHLGVFLLRARRSNASQAARLNRNRPDLTLISYE